MAIINSYPLVIPKLTDLILGTSAGSNGKNKTASFTVSALQNVLTGITSITSTNVNTIVIGGNAKAVTIGAVTAVIAQNGPSLATGGDIYTFVTTNHPGTVSGTGTADTLTKWSTNGIDIENSSITDVVNGATITITDRQLWPNGQGLKDLGGQNNKWKNLWAAETLYGENIALTGTNTYISLGGSTGAVGQVLTSGGTGVSATWTDNGNVSGTGTINTVPIFTGATAIGDSLISQAANTVIINGSGTDGRLQLNCSAGTHGVTIQSPPHSASATYTLILPQTTGAAGQVLTSGGGATDQLAWATNGNVGGTGTGEKISKWINATTLGDSIMTEATDTISIAGNLSLQEIEVNETFKDGSGQVGGAGQLLSSTGTATSWVTPAPTGVTSFSTTDTNLITITPGTTPHTGAVVATPNISDGVSLASSTLATGTQIQTAINTALAGAVQSVTSANTNVITIGGSSANPTVTANTAAVTAASANLATGTQIQAAIDLTVLTVATGNANTITIGGTVTNPTVAANTTAGVGTGLANLATGGQIQAAINTALAGAVTFKGTFNANTGAITSGGNLTTGGARVAVAVGDMYVVSIAGNFYGSTLLNIGDEVIAVSAAAAGTSVQGDWNAVPSAGSGVTDISPGNTAIAISPSTGSVVITSTAFAGGSTIGHVPSAAAASSGQYLDYQGNWTTLPTGDTYTIQAGAKAGTSIPLQLDATVGSDSTVNLTEGNGITLTQTSSSEITIDAAVGVTGSGTVNIVPLWTPTSTNLGDSVIAQSGTNIGIGTTSPADKLSISSSLNQIGLDSGDIATYGTLDLGMFTNGAFIGTQPGSNTASDLLRFGTSGTERMRINSAGNVGIGTTNPVSNLDVKTSGTTILTANTSGFTTAGDGTGFGVYRSNTGRQSGYSWLIDSTASSGGASVSEYQTDKISFNIRKLATDANLTEAMTITPAGNVGINVTDPDAQLEIVNSAGGSYRLGYGGTDSYFDSENFYIRAGNGNSNKLIVDSAGKVGIGTTSPASLLHLESASSPVLTIKDTTANVTLLAYSQDDNAHIGTASNHDFIFDTNSVERMRINTSGQVKFNAYTSASAFTGTAVADLAVDGSGNIITKAAGGGGLAIAEVTAGATVAAAATTLYVFTASSGSVSTLTLPASPAVGDTIKISNIGGLANIVGANTNNIMGVSTDMTIDVATSSFELIWTGISATGWVILSNV